MLRLCVFFCGDVVRCWVESPSRWSSQYPSLSPCRLSITSEPCLIAGWALRPSVSSTSSIWYCPRDTRLTQVHHPHTPYLCPKETLFITGEILQCCSEMSRLVLVSAVQTLMFYSDTMSFQHAQKLAGHFFASQIVNIWVFQHSSWKGWSEQSISTVLFSDKHQGLSEWLVQTCCESVGGLWVFTLLCCRLWVAAYWPRSDKPINRWAKVCP